VTLDRTGPTIGAALAAPGNGTSYDVGTPIGVTWTATDLNGVISSGAAIEGQTISSSGGTIDVDVLTSGTHTITITSIDRAGNVTLKSITFTIHATPQGIINAIADGAARKWISSSFASTLTAQMQQVLKATSTTSANGKAKLNQFISYLQYPPAGGITAAYRTLLLNWSYDLLARL
jgi:cytochrome c